MNITSLITELEGREVAMGIKCQISVDQTVFSYDKIHQPSSGEGQLFKQSYQQNPL